MGRRASGGSTAAVQRSDRFRGRNAPSELARGAALRVRPMSNASHDFFSYCTVFFCSLHIHLHLSHQNDMADSDYSDASFSDRPPAPPPHRTPSFDHRRGAPAAHARAPRGPPPAAARGMDQDSYSDEDSANGSDSESDSEYPPPRRREDPLRPPPASGALGMPARRSVGSAPLGGPPSAARPAAARPGPGAHKAPAHEESDYDSAEDSESEPDVDPTWRPSAVRRIPSEHARPAEHRPNPQPPARRPVPTGRAGGAPPPPLLDDSESDGGSLALPRAPMPGAFGGHGAPRGPPTPRALDSGPPDSETDSGSEEDLPPRLTGHLRELQPSRPAGQQRAPPRQPLGLSDDESVPSRIGPATPVALPLSAMAPRRPAVVAREPSEISELDRADSFETARSGHDAPPHGPPAGRSVRALVDKFGGPTALGRHGESGMPRRPVARYKSDGGESVDEHLGKPGRAGADPFGDLDPPSMHRDHSSGTVREAKSRGHSPPRGVPAAGDDYDDLEDDYIPKRGSIPSFRGGPGEHGAPPGRDEYDSGSEDGYNSADQKDDPYPHRPSLHKPASRKLSSAHHEAPHDLGAPPPAPSNLSDDELDAAPGLPGSLRAPMGAHESAMRAESPLPEGLDVRDYQLPSSGEGASRPPSVLSHHGRHSRHSRHHHSPPRHPDGLDGGDGAEDDFSDREPREMDAGRHPHEDPLAFEAGDILERSVSFAEAHSHHGDDGDADEEPLGDVPPAEPRAPTPAEAAAGPEAVTSDEADPVTLKEYVGSLKTFSSELASCEKACRSLAQSTRSKDKAARLGKVYGQLHELASRLRKSSAPVEALLARHPNRYGVIVLGGGNALHEPGIRYARWADRAKAFVAALEAGELKGDRLRDEADSLVRRTAKIVDHQEKEVSRSLPSRSEVPGLEYNDADCRSFLLCP